MQITRKMSSLRTDALADAFASLVLCTLMLLWSLTYQTVALWDCQHSGCFFFISEKRDKRVPAPLCLLYKVVLINWQLEKSELTGKLSELIFILNWKDTCKTVDALYVRVRVCMHGWLSVNVNACCESAIRYRVSYLCWCVNLKMLGMSLRGPSAGQQMSLFSSPFFVSFFFPSVLFFLVTNLKSLVRKCFPAAYVEAHTDVKSRTRRQCCLTQHGVRVTWGEGEREGTNITSLLQILTSHAPSYLFSFILPASTHFAR